MSVVLLLESRPMYDMDTWIVGVEEARNKYISCRLRWKSREDFGSRHRLHLTRKEASSRRAFFAVTSFVSFQLVVVLLFVFGEIVFDFGKLSDVSTSPQTIIIKNIPRQGSHTSGLQMRKLSDCCSLSLLRST